MAILSYFTILPWDLHLDHCHLSRHLPRSRRSRLKLIRLEKGAILEARWWDMRANVHVYIHRSVVELVQLQHLVSGEIKKSQMLHPLLPWLKLNWRSLIPNTMYLPLVKIYILPNHPTTCLLDSLSRLCCICEVTYELALLPELLEWHFPSAMLAMLVIPWQHVTFS